MIWLAGSTPYQPTQEGAIRLEAEEAFVKLKQAMISTPTLAMPDFSDAFIIKTDASDEGIEAII